MKGYRKPAGIYIELTDNTPVNQALVQVALRPSPDHVFTATWANAPMDPAVCWRAQTTAEANAGKDTDLQAFLDSAGGKVVKSIVTVLISKGTLTLADIKAVFRTL